MKFLNLQQPLDARNELGEMRVRRTFSSAQQTQVQLHDQSLLNFSSNDYLGLANSSAAQLAIQTHVKTFGFGSGASHLICGHQTAHDELEKALANFVEREHALTFSSGYMANLAILQSLAAKGDVIIADKLNHASLIDGAQLSAARTLRYQHCDMLALETRLKQTSQNKFVVTDSVFSMDGDIAPLIDIVALCEHYNAILIVDDAHGFGVLGEEGKGCGELFNLTQKKLPVLMSTLGKALGGFGAFVSGEKVLIDYLIQFARSYVYTTAMPSLVAQANLANLKYLIDHPNLINQLQQNIHCFRKLCAHHGVPISQSITAIQPIMIGCNEKVLQVYELLMAQGILVGAIRPPTVAKNSARLRITLTATHTVNDIEKLVFALKVSLQQLNEANQS